MMSATVDSHMFSQYFPTSARVDVPGIAEHGILLGNQGERDHYSQNLSILIISSYSD